MREQPSLGHISPFFIVSNVPRAIKFYEEKLGFETRFLAPEAGPFFAIVGRDSVQVYLKNVSDDSTTITPQPNNTRHRWAPRDAFVFLADPDALAAELAGRGVEFHTEIQDTDDGLRGFEIRDTEAFDGNRYFDVVAEYAKASPDDLLIRLTVSNRGPEPAPIHVLPTLWFRNTWSWGRHGEGYWEKPSMAADAPDRIRADHATLGSYVLAIDAAPGGKIGRAHV